MSHVTSVFCLSAGLAPACVPLGAQRILATMRGTVQSELLGSMVAALGDLDGDGVPDYAVGARLASTPNIHLCSGRDAHVLRTLTGPTSEEWGASIADIGDVNADGVHDLAVGDPTFTSSAGRVVIVEPRTGAIVRTVVGTSGQGELGRSVAGAGDVDGDGTPDFAASAPREAGGFGSRSSGAVFVYSGRTGGLLRTVAAPIYGSAFGTSLSGLGDVNGDGVPDFAVGSFWRNSSDTEMGSLWFASGLTGGILMQMEGLRPSSAFAQVCAGIGDFDGDGIRDVVVSAPQETDLVWNQGAVRVISGRLLARATLEGTGCGGGPFVPLLGGTRPVVGTTALLVGEWPPGAPGFVLLSPPPTRPTNLGVPECHAYVDIASAIVLLPIAPGISRGTLPLPVPSLPGFAGLEFEFQVLYGPTSGPLGFDLTNGLRWRVGW